MALDPLNSSNLEQLALKGLTSICQMPIHVHILAAILTCKVGQNDLVWRAIRFVSGSVHTRLQVSVCSGYTIWSTLVDIQTDIQTHTERQHFDQLIRKAQPAELKIPKYKLTNTVQYNTFLTWHATHRIG